MCHRGVQLGCGKARDSYGTDRLSTSGEITYELPLELLNAEEAACSAGRWQLLVRTGNEAEAACFVFGNLTWCCPGQRIREVHCSRAASECDWLKVIERTRMEQILTEQHFGYSGRVDTFTAAEIGRLLGADVLVLGTVNVLEQKRGRGS